MEIAGLARESREMRVLSSAVPHWVTLCWGALSWGLGDSFIPCQSRTPVAESGELEWRKKKEERKKRTNSGTEMCFDFA